MSDTLIDPRIAALNSRKRIAAALLVFAALVLLAARITEQHLHHWSLALLAAMAEAALVGGLADWFAVVALFRHPLGQRWIPHTAIIPTRKDAIGESLADFIANHFLGREQVAEKLREVDIGAALARRLTEADTSRAVGRAVARGLARVLDVLSDERLLRFAHDMSRERLRSLDLSGLAALGIERFTADGRHQALVTDVLRFLSDKLQSPSVQDEVKRRVAREVGRVLRWLGADEYASNRLISAGIELIGEMAEDPDHELRQYIETQVQGFAARLRTDERLRAEVDAFRDRLLDSDDFLAYVRSLLADLVRWVDEDAARDDSVIATRVAQGLHAVGERLLEDADLRDWVSSSVRETVEPLIDEHRDAIRRFIVDRIRRWNAEEMTRELELAVGSDLQFIRYNGTAVGALVGGLIFAASRLLGLAG
ncbi:DUF445 domain-containing protein [Cognatilysobacter terrigena]|uniref:DUF445 domain-containing protein n=1 Tax=Cognatilysobacter terrigena TaxID=2488749 RepID=UPI0010613B63|nr:DUF445 domain-containing protein [Lysobacter terrigena]